MNGLQPFWLLARTDAGRMGVLTAGLAEGKKALPVFSFEDEARMFLDFGVARDGWQVRETTTGELVSMLLGPCADVGTILLDPLPGPCGRAAANLVGVPREAFVDHLLDRRRCPNAPERSPPRPRRDSNGHQSFLEKSHEDRFPSPRRSRRWA